MTAQSQPIAPPAPAPTMADVLAMALDDLLRAEPGADQHDAVNRARGALSTYRVHRELPRRECWAVMYGEGQRFGYFTHQQTATQYHARSLENGAPVRLLHMEQIVPVPTFPGLS